MASKLVDSVVAFLDEPFANADIFGVKIDVEAILIAAILFLLMQKSYQPEKKPLTQNEIDQLCEEWVPEPLHPLVTKQMKMKTPFLESAAGPHTTVDGKEVVNLAGANYLGLIEHPKVKENLTKLAKEL